MPQLVAPDHFSTGVWRADTPAAVLASYSCLECGHRTTTWEGFREHRRGCPGYQQHAGFPEAVRSLWRAALGPRLDAADWEALDALAAQLAPDPEGMAA